MAFCINNVSAIGRRMGGTGYSRLVQFYAEGIGQFWEQDDIHVSSDTSFAKGRMWDWLSLDAVQDWNAFIGSRQVNELHLDPSKRKYHRYIPFPESIRDGMNQTDEIRAKLTIHHQLLTGVVLYIDPTEITQDELEALDYCAVNKKGIIRSEGQYEKGKPTYQKDTYLDNPVLVSTQMEKLWEAKNNFTVIRVYYRFPQTFDNNNHYIPEGVRKFLLYIQNNMVFNGTNRVDASGVDVAIDHIVPRSDGGTNTLVNLVAVERTYNSVDKREKPDPFRPDYKQLFMIDTDPVSISPKYLEMLLDGRLSSPQVKVIHRYMKALAKKRLGFKL